MLFEKILKNPFDVESPEKLTFDQIKELYVPDDEIIGLICQRKHTFIWGNRGSGKSMLLRFLEPKCFYKSDEFLKKELNEQNSFLGIYYPIKEGMLNKTEFKLLDETLASLLSEHIFIIQIAERTISCIKEQLNIFDIKKEKAILFKENVLALYDPLTSFESIKTIKKYEDELDYLKEFFKKELIKVIKYITTSILPSNNCVYSGALGGYYDFLIPFFREVKEMLSLKSTCIYLLIDDAGRMHRFQQKILNSWIANRDQNDLCIKVSAVNDEYLSFSTKDNWLISEPHDYSEITMDKALYTSANTNYSEKILKIANKRLEKVNAGIKNIEELFPMDQLQQSMLKEIKKQLAEEWEREKIGEKYDYINRYSNPRLYQKISSAKQSPNYSGFSNIVHISSGIIRNFLEPCFKIFEQQFGNDFEPEKITPIPASVQNKVIIQYSKEFLNRIDDIKKDVVSDETVCIDKLKRLVESMGRLFYIKLHDANDREARVFSFTISDEDKLDVETNKILSYGVKYGYFQKSTYPTKSGGGTEPWYILNRRLCPAYKIDPTGFMGRVSLKSVIVKLACDDTKEFLKLKMVSKNKIDSLQISICDISVELED